MKALLAATLICLAGLCEARASCPAPGTPDEPATKRAGVMRASLPAGTAPPAALTPVTAIAPRSPSPASEPPPPSRHLPLAGVALMVAIALRRHRSTW